MASAEGDHGSDFEETMFCEPCYKEGNNVQAEGFCSDCSDYLCSTCMKYHKRLTSSHSLLDKSNMPQDFCFERCAVHPNDLVKFYCPKCDETACSECIPIKHQTECSEFKHIPTSIQSQDVYGEIKEIKHLLEDVKEEADRNKDEIDKTLKEVTINSNDISKSISIQKGYLIEEMEKQRVEIFKKLEKERAEIIRKLDERQGQRKEKLFEQQKLVNRKINDEARHLDEQLMLYPKKMHNVALNSAKINMNLESLMTDIYSKERHGQKAEVFLVTRRVKRNMKTLQRELDSVREDNVARCLIFRPNKKNISIDAMKKVSLGTLSEKTDTRDTTKYQQGPSNSSKFTEVAATMENVCTELSTTETVPASYALLSLGEKQIFAKQQQQQRFSQASTPFEVKSLTSQSNVMPKQTSNQPKDLMSSLMQSNVIELNSSANKPISSYNGPAGVGMSSSINYYSVGNLTAQSSMSVISSPFGLPFNQSKLDSSRGSSMSQAFFCPSTVQGKKPIDKSSFDNRMSVYSQKTGIPMNQTNWSSSSSSKQTRRDEKD